MGASLFAQYATGRKRENYERKNQFNYFRSQEH